MMSLQFFHSLSAKDIVLEISPRQSDSGAEEAYSADGHFALLFFVLSLSLWFFICLFIYYSFVFVCGFVCLVLLVFNLFFACYKLTPFIYFFKCYTVPDTAF